MRGCLRWNGRSHELACIDDLCHGADTTLCGLERGIDFDETDEMDVDYDLEEYEEGKE